MTFYISYAMIYTVLVYGFVIALKKIKVKHGVDGGSRTHRTQGLSLLYMPILLHPHISVRDKKKKGRFWKGFICERRFPDGWCKRRDSNPYANAADSKSAMSAYSITLARFNLNTALSYYSLKDY